MKATRGGIALLVALLATTSWVGASAAASTTFTVTSSGDGSDANPGNGMCDDGSGACTLRAALEEANANAGVDLIAFSIGSGAQTIAPATALPPATDPVVVDGTTQPGYAGAPLIELDGTATAASFGAGFDLQAGASTVRGLAINRFYYGVILRGAGNTVEGNYLGTDPAGTVDRGNQVGVLAQDSPGNTIGGTTGAARNVVSGNDAIGIWIFGATSTGNHVRGNYVGLDATGTVDLGNGGTGVALSFGSGNTIGGATAGARNVISGNDFGGVQINGAGAAGNDVRGNYVGTNAAGSAAVANGQNGIWIIFAPSTTIAGNLISGNPKGIEIALGVSGTVIQGNYVGTNAAGTSAIPNGSGIESSGNATVIGGSTAAERNVISGNTSFGINSFFGSAGEIRGNYVGVDATGTAALGNGASGMAVFAFGWTVAGNVVSANGNGMTIGNQTVVEGNKVGTNAAGTSALGNAGAGILVFGSGNQFGGASAGAANLIAHNGGDGIAVFGIGNAIRRNSIFANGGLGIDISDDGVTPNDPGDADTGPNQRQNFPTLTQASSSGGTTTVEGTLNSTPSSTFDLEFFASSACDPSGFGEGATYLGTTSVTTDAAGNASFTASFATTVAAGDFVTSTARSSAGDTSEFSACLEAKLADLSVTKADAPDPVVHKKPLLYTIVVANAGPSSATGVVLTDTLPATVTFVSATPSQGACSQTAGVVTCTLGAIASGGTATVTIEVTPNVAGVIANSVSVTAAEADPVGSNNTAVATTKVLGPPHPAPPCKKPQQCP